MAKAGKGLVRAIGTQVLAADGTVVAFDALESSCCCEVIPDPPDQTESCPISVWGAAGIPPEGALYPNDISTHKIPRCITATLAGGAFAGEYQLHYESGTTEVSAFAAVQFRGKHAVIALVDTEIKTFDSETGSKTAQAFFAGHEYEIDIVIEVGLGGSFGSGNVNTYLGVRYTAGWTPDSGVGAIIYYTGSIPFFDHPTAQKLLTPCTAADCIGDGRVNWMQFHADPTEYDMTVDFTNLGSEVSEGRGRGSSRCEWWHDRYIGHTQQIATGSSSALDSTWYQQSVYSAHDPLNATKFGNARGYSVVSSGRGYAGMEIDPSDRDLDYETVFGWVNALVAKKRIPWHYTQGVTLEATFDTEAFVRNGSAPVGEFAQAQGLGGTYIGFGIELNRIFEVNRNDFGANPQRDVEMVSYWIATGHEALTSTQAIPATVAHLSPFENCLPDTTTVKVELLFDSLWIVDERVRGITYRRRQTINLVVVEDIYLDIPYHDLWAEGELTVSVTVDSAPWYENHFTPKLFTQFAQGFDDACKGGMSSVSVTPTNTLTDHYAPLYCPSVNPKLYLSAQGAKDNFDMSHALTFHLGEGVGTHAAYDATGTMTPSIWLLGLSTLPTGLSTDHRGVMTGTPTTEGLWPVIGSFIDFNGLVKGSWQCDMEVKVRDPAFQYDPNGFVSGGTNTEGVDWYMRDGDSGTIEADAHWGTTPYVMSYTGDALDGASFDVATGDWVLSPAHTQTGNTSGTVNMKLLDDTNKTNFVTKTWFREGGTPPV